MARNGGRSRTTIASAMNVEPQTMYTVTSASQTRTPCRAAIRPGWRWRTMRLKSSAARLHQHC